MRNFLFGLAFFCLAAASAIPDSSFLDDYRFFQSLHPRPEGSQGERLALEYIGRRLDEMALPYRRIDASEAESVHTFSYLLEAAVPGRLADTLILAVPVDQAPDDPPGRDGSINPALALSLLEGLRRSPPPVTVRVLFLGAEHGGADAAGADASRLRPSSATPLSATPTPASPASAPDGIAGGIEDDTGAAGGGSAYPLGSRLFLRDFFPEYRVMVLYLNLKAPPSRLILRSAGQRVAAPYWLIDGATQALEEAGVFFLARGNENQIFRIGLTSEHTVIEPFLQAGYPALSFEGEYALEGDGPGEAGLWAESFLRFFSLFAARFDRGIPDSWDRHYLFFQARSFYRIVDEKTYLVLLLGALTAVSLYGVAFTGRVRKYARTIGRRFWTLPVLFLLGFGSLLLSTWLLEGVLALRRMRLLWAQLPLLFLVFKLAAALLPLVLLRDALRRLPFSRNGSFYSAAAILFLFLDIAILAVFNISFTYYFLWAFCFALLFALTRSKPLKLLFFLASPYWLIKTLVELFALPRQEFCRLVLLSPIWGNLLLTAALLPFALMLVRIEMVLPSFSRVRRRTRFRLAGQVLALFLAGLFLSFLLFQPYNERNRQPVAAEGAIDLSAGIGSLALSSPAPLGGLQVLENGRPQPVEDLHAWIGPEPEVELASMAGLLSRIGREPDFGLTSRAALSALPPAPRVEVFSAAFLDRKNVVVRFNPTERPAGIRLLLSGSASFVLYDANFPYRRNPRGDEYEILIGRNPPVPLEVQLTLPQGADYELDMVFEYPGLPRNLEIRGENLLLEARYTVRKRMPLRT